MQRSPFVSLFVASLALAAPDPQPVGVGRDQPSTGWTESAWTEREVAVGASRAQTWVLTERPEGDGPVRLWLDAGADVVEVADDRVRLVGEGRVWRYDHLLAWDALGRVLPARFEAAGRGIAVVVEDAGAVWPVTVDPLMGEDLVTLRGEVAEGAIGAWIVAAGDVDGDGFDDLLTGGPGTLSVGFAELWYGGVGGSTGVLTVPGDTASPQPGLPAVAADVDDDGFSDLVFGHGSQSGVGPVTIRRGGLGGLDLDPWRVLSPSVGDERFGDVLAVGEVDGDGLPDVFVRAVVGGVPVVRGFSGATIEAGGAADWTLTGDGLRFGEAITLGDLDGDGADEVIIGSPDETGQGRIAVWAGSPFGDPPDPAWILAGTTPGAGYGESVLSGFDADGDGDEELAVGAPYDGVDLRGTVWIYDGGPGLGLDDPPSSVVGDTPQGQLGRGLGLAGDLAGDGYDDVLLLADSLGWSFVMEGSPAGLTTPSHRVRRLDWPVLRGVGDHDDDGFDDIGLGLPSAAVSRAGGELSGAGAVILRGGIHGEDRDGDSFEGAWADGFGGTRGDGQDCDDTDPDVWPGGIEHLSDGADGNCDGLERCRADLDGDGVAAAGAPEVLVASITCSGDGGAPDGGPFDCDDTNAAAAPGLPERCDERSVDEDCDGLADDDDPDVLQISKTPFFPDADGDGAGDALGLAFFCRPPAGYVNVPGDCDDDDAAVGLPSATWAFDGDGDGFGDGRVLVVACASPGEGWVLEAGDCDDADPLIGPGVDEVCGGGDEDCDGLTDDADPDVILEGYPTYFADADGDGLGDRLTGAPACERPAGWVEIAEDCDDTDASIGAASVLWFADLDGDGYGDFGSGALACGAGDGRVANGDDCDDDDADRSPSADEVCGGGDDDCDGRVDDADDDVAGAASWWADLDGDGFGAGAVVAACVMPANHVGQQGDCDDTNPARAPDQVEVCDEDNTDEDCNGLADNADPAATGLFTFYRDADRDGFGTTPVLACDVGPGTAVLGEDCDDGNPRRTPAAQEVCDPNNVDEDCDGVSDDDDNTVHAPSRTRWHRDADGDGFGDPANSQLRCDPRVGETADGTDCDDGARLIHPGALETCGAAVDANCDGFAGNDDRDGDGTIDCLDCGPEDDTIGPLQAERCNGFDDDCDGSVDEAGALGGFTWYIDADGDGFGDAGRTLTACGRPNGAVSVAGDCDDGNADIAPGAEEVVGDGIDQDCDGAEACFLDGDRDGYLRTAPAQVDAADGDCDDPGEGDALTPRGDCDDGNAAVSPAATEICNNLDDDCNGEVDDDARDADLWWPDADEDGYTPVDGAVASCVQPADYFRATDPVDCDDSNPKALPGGKEIPGDGIDQDCSGEDTPGAPEGCACDSGTTGAPRLAGAALLLLLAARRRRA